MHQHQLEGLARLRGALVEAGDWRAISQELPSQHFNWESGHTETACLAFLEKDHWVNQETIDKSIKNSTNRLSDRGGLGVYVHNLGACTMSSKEDQLVTANDGDPVDYLDVMRGAYTNKKTGKIQNPLVRDVIDLVESQKQEYLASQPLSDDGSSASTNLSRVRVNEMVEEAVPKKKGRLVGLALRASSCPSSQTSYVDPMIMDELQKKDERIVALESQNATILAQMAQQDA
uniref:Uncharacterized protein n=1 Tax=Brassica oleracea var. oleracea TaxID=109376 RepID=A0A0D3CQ61_BRAOL